MTPAPTGELTLKDLLDDPLIRLLMWRDGVRADDLRDMMQRIILRP